MTEYQLAAVSCAGCGTVTRAVAPSGVAGPCCYGPNVRAATALLAVTWGILTNRHRDWPSGRHPGYTLPKRLQARAAQVWRFTIDFAVPFTNNPAEQPNAWSNSR